MNFRYVVALVLGLLLVGYYEAIRLSIAELARKEDPTRAENILSYPFAERNLTSYTGPDFTHKLGVYVPFVGDADEYLVQNQQTTCWPRPLSLAHPELRREAMNWSPFR